MTRYHCTNCNHAFEAEPKEGLECPSCFWTSSVLEESQHREHAAAERDGALEKKSWALPTGVIMVIEALKPLFILLLLAAVLAGGWYVLKPLWPKLTERFRSNEVKVRISESPASANPKSTKKTAKVQPTDAAADKSQLPAALTQEDHAVLARKIELRANRELSPMEQSILSRRAALKTGRVEKLPGPVWSLEQYKKMLDEQQLAYQVPLPRSYRGKLQTLFETKYLTGAQAFTEGRLLEARNLWVEALAFPIYANDIEKHRGVALTMLRPFINDTLSKIGALNGMLVEGPVRDRETALNQAYDQFLKNVQAQNWDAAYAGAEQIIKLTADFDQNSVQMPQVPAYVPSAQIDRDIGKALFDLLEASRPATADVGALEQDVRMKKQVIETLLPERFTQALQTYQQAFDALDNTSWQKAHELFAQVKEPAVLQRDSAEKMKVLQKIMRLELESPQAAG